MVLIDWDNPPELESPKRKARDPHDRERLARAHLRRRKHKPSKAHATGKRRADIQRRKKGKREFNKKASLQAYFAMRDRIRAYWRGEIDEHPNP